MYYLDRRWTRLATWLTGTQAIEHLNISRSMFYRLVREGKIAAYTLPGMHDPRYKQEELDALYTPTPTDDDKEEG